jgi:hypothetical protein
MPEQFVSSHQVGPNQAKHGIRSCIRIQRPLFLWGPPGIGKSDIVKQIGEEQGREVIDVRLSLWEPTDIKGIPYYNSDKKTMVWAPPAELPTDPDSTAILFLDELNSAAPATQAAAFQLVLNRQVGTYVLPKGVSIIAAGNRDSDKGVTYRMPTPLANRFVHLELKSNFDDYLEWATQNRIHEQVLGYLSFSKKHLYDFDPKSPSRAFATPRSWSFVSDLLQDKDLPEDMLTYLIAGTVGEGITTSFMAHRKIAKQMPNPEDILSGKVKKSDITEISAMYSLAVSMCYELQTAYENKVKNWDEMADNFFAFTMDNFSTELVVMSAKIALSNYKLPFDASKLKNFDRFHNQYGKFIVSALS